MMDAAIAPINHIDIFFQVIEDHGEEAGVYGGIGIVEEAALLPGELLYGIKAIPIPGATPGETAFYSNAGGLILGDAVINTSTERGLEFLPDKYCTDAKQNRESLRQLLTLDFKILTLAHGAPVVDRAKDKLTALLNSSS